MKFLLIPLFLLAGLFSQQTFACECGTSKSNKKLSKEEARKQAGKFYLEKFKGALFTGKVLSVEEIPVKEANGLFTLKNKYTVEVEKYWLGVSQPIMVFYVSVSDCGIRFEKDQSYFFHTQLIDGELKTNTCAYQSENEKKAEGRHIREWNEILGEAKSFKATKQ